MNEIGYLLLWICLCVLLIICWSMHRRINFLENELWNQPLCVEFGDDDDYDDFDIAPEESPEHGERASVVIMDEIVEFPPPADHRS